ncbi:MAG: tetratricopeptide repeat protein, partial [Pseudomonadota bacterium]|nr:tetratricopeptide repeat protein [Pseudomonadota bacterium]
TTTPQVVAYAPPPPAAPALPPAADGLAKQAEQQRQMGDYVGAAATLERALRIQPQEAYLWNRLAHVRMEQGLYSQAGNLAERSNVLARDQASLKQDNWSMIAVSRRTAGDAAGAAEAEEKARGG